MAALALCHRQQKPVVGHVDTWTVACVLHGRVGWTSAYHVGDVGQLRENCHSSWALLLLMLLVGCGCKLAKVLRLILDGPPEIHHLSDLPM